MPEIRQQPCDCRSHRPRDSSSSLMIVGKRAAGDTSAKSALPLQEAMLQGQVRLRLEAICVGLQAASVTIGAEVERVAKMPLAATGLHPHLLSQDHTQETQALVKSGLTVKDLVAMTGIGTAHRGVGTNGKVVMAGGTNMPRISRKERRAQDPVLEVRADTVGAHMVGEGATEAAQVPEADEISWTFTAKGETLPRG